MRGAVLYACEFGVLLTLALSMATHAQSPKARNADSRLQPLPVDNRPGRTKPGSGSGGQLFKVSYRIPTLSCQSR
jgi:hypothetical protein